MCGCPGAIAGGPAERQRDTHRRRITVGVIGLVVRGFPTEAPPSAQPTRRPQSARSGEGEQILGRSHGTRRSTRTAAADWGRDAGEVKTVTRDRDFKQVVRARMAQTGETYTAARAAVEQTAPPRVATTPGPTDQTSFETARREQERLVDRLFTGGRLAQIPAKRKARAGALLEVLTRFEPGRVYTEPEVNEILRSIHEDFAYLRRELVNYHYLERAEGRYRVVEQAPTRAPIERQEIPDWEAVWLPEFLAGRA